MTEVLDAPQSEVQEIGGADAFRQLYSTALLDVATGQAFEWAHLPADLLGGEEVDFDSAMQAMELTLVTELTSWSALPAAIVAMLESGDLSNPEEVARDRLQGFLSAGLGTWSLGADPATRAFAEFAAFSAVLPVEWSPIRKVPVPDAVTPQVRKAAAAGIAPGATAGAHLALTVGAHGLAIVAIGAGGAVVGAVAAPVGVVAALALARKLLRSRLA